jgi:NAD dependent epimerase/dehydratase family enzyme
MATLLLDGQNARPQALTTAGYRFLLPGLPEALEDLA